MQWISHKKHAVNLAPAERVISVFGGAALATWGIRRRSAAGIAMALIGGDLVRRGATGHSHLYKALGVRTAPLGQGAATTSVPYDLGIRVDKAITVDRPRHEVYRYWRDVSNLPSFMKHLESVTILDDKRSHWVTRAPAGRTVEWDAEIYNESENEMIAWRSLPGAGVRNAGSVWFKDATGGRGTAVTVELQYNPPAGTLGALVAKMWGEEPGQQIQDDLHRFKQMMETGEIATTEGQPAGAGRSRAAKTGDHSIYSRETDSVGAASEESFPASDSPAWRG
ncbi:MAG TPA: SRPBCC family protein [Bryobacteraceae bacterium]|nr:SRPBCC family protein [Bryobacteraceae bacterium]